MRKTNQKLKSLLAHYQPLDEDLMYEQSLSIDINPLSALDERCLTARWSHPKWTAKTKGWQHD